MVRMIDIAKHAGVSLGTVSAVLSGKMVNIRVSKEKTELIHTIAREMNYIPNFASKVLTRQASMSLGVLIDSEDVEVRFRQLAVIEREAERHGYRLIIAESHHNPQKQSVNYRTLLQYGVDAVICHANCLPDDIPDKRKIILYGAEAVPGFSMAYYDIETGYAEAIEAFRHEGRRNIALAITNNPDSESVRARRRAFLNLVPEREDYIYILPSLDQNIDRIRKVMETLIQDFILAKRIDAIIVQNDICALSLVNELIYNGIKVPRAISVVGQDNLSFGRCIRPSLSTIDPNLDELGNTVIRLILERLENPEAPVRSAGVNTWLVRRETTLPVKSTNKSRSRVKK